MHSFKHTHTHVIGCRALLPLRVVHRDFFNVLAVCGVPSWALKITLRGLAMALAFHRQNPVVLCSLPANACLHPSNAPFPEPQQGDQPSSQHLLQSYFLHITQLGNCTTRTEQAGPKETPPSGPTRQPQASGISLSGSDHALKEAVGVVYGHLS